MIAQFSLAAIFLLILTTLRVPAPREVARIFAPLIPNQREDGKIALNNIEAKSVFIFDISQNKMLYELFVFQLIYIDVEGYYKLL